MRVSFNAHSVFVATIGKHNNLLHWDEMKTTLKLEAIDIEQTSVHSGLICEAPIQVGVLRNSFFTHNIPAKPT